MTPQFSALKPTDQIVDLPRESAIPRVLSIAGTDPTGGAGTAADLKSISAAGGYAMAVTTAVVAQNTRGVTRVHIPPLEVLQAQLQAVSTDVTVDAVKTGMLANSEIIRAVSTWFEQVPTTLLVVDPVMVATSGDRLLDREAEDAMRQLCTQASVITPNLDELAVLLQAPVATDIDTALRQATDCAQTFNTSVILKTGHLTGERADNYWVNPEGVYAQVGASRVETSCTHGTGCSLSSALATRLASGEEAEAALRWCTRWLHEAISFAAALQVGHGHGPVDHFHRLRRQGALADPRPRPSSADLDWQSPPPLEATASVAARIPAAGPWTRALWEVASEQIAAIENCLGLRHLLDGTLSPQAFEFYLAQDACYLGEYARVLASAAALAPSEAAQVFFARSAADAIEVELQLHRDYLGAQFASAPGSVTNAYTQFLLAQCARGSYLQVVSALLPCFWVYAHIGASVEAVEASHPYAAWLLTYSDENFLAVTDQALGLVEEAFAAASPGERAQAARTFVQACWHELEFFDQADRF